jgi:hypothetical protein
MGGFEALAAGWPIATGVIEGAARHLIGDRLDIAGSRWGIEGAEAILRLRAVIDNGDFEAYWAFHNGKDRPADGTLGLIPRRRRDSRRSHSLRKVPVFAAPLAAWVQHPFRYASPCPFPGFRCQGPDCGRPGPAHGVTCSRTHPLSPVRRQVILGEAARAVRHPPPRGDELKQARSAVEA